MQLVFGHDATMILTFNANWNIIKMQKQEAINKNNAKENCKHIQHKYKVNDQVLVKNQQSTKFGQDAYNGPLTVSKVQDDRTFKITKGVVTGIYNILNITPYIS